MTKHTLSNQHVMMISWNQLETVLKMMTASQKQPHVTDTVAGIQHHYRVDGPEKALFSLVTAIAWLTEDGTGSADG